MKKNRKIPDNELSNEIYATSRATKIKIVLAAGALLFLGFVFNFPVKETIRSQIIAALNNFHACSITYDALDVSTFILPKVTLQDTIISGPCLGSRNNSINLGNVVLKISGPSFYPPGIKLHLSVKKGETEINAYPSLSFIKHIIKIQDTYISSELLKGIDNNDEIFTGKIFIEAKLELERNNIAAAKLLIKSSNLSIPSRKIDTPAGPLELPELAIRSVLIKASILKDNLSIQELFFGNESSPIIGNIKGKIKLNRFNFLGSKPDLRGELKLSPEFSSKFGGMLSLVAGSAKPKNGFYQFKIQSFNSFPRFY